MFLGSREEKQIPRFARDDKNYFFLSLFSLRGFGEQVGWSLHENPQPEQAAEKLPTPFVILSGAKNLFFFS